MNDSTPPESEPGLFDLPGAAGRAGFREPPAPREQLGRGARQQALTDRRIAAGLHPLAGIIPHLRLHPDAPREDARNPDTPGPRCGDCAHRQLFSYHARTYPKCARTEATFSHSDVSDCRAWWPACRHFTTCQTGEVASANADE